MPTPASDPVSDPGPRGRIGPSTTERLESGSTAARCPDCGYVGQPIPHFRRTGHAVVLVLAALLTYGIAALVYWVMKRDEQICPGCGRRWRGVPSVPRTGREDRAGGGPARGGPDPDETGMPSGPSRFGPDGRSGPLPRSGSFRRAVGILVLAAGLVGLTMALLAREGSLAIAAAWAVVAGAGLVAWGRRARERRRTAVMDALELRVLDAAEARGGRLTATALARDLHLTLSAADRVLFYMDDGLRVRSEVTREGLLVFDFPEIRLGPALPEASPPFALPTPDAPPPSREPVSASVGEALPLSRGSVSIQSPEPYEDSIDPGDFGAQDPR